MMVRALPATLLGPLCGLLLPLAFWFCQFQGWPFWFAGVFLLPLSWSRRGTGMAPWAALATGTLALWALLGRDTLPVKLYPVLANVGLLASFGFTLIRPPSMVERFARLTEPQLPSRAITYTRRVTQVWCIFFAVNGTLALITALWMSERAWALYNGLIAYLLIGTLFVIEWCVRQRVRRAVQEDAPHA